MSARNDRGSRTRQRERERGRERGRGGERGVMRTAERQPAAFVLVKIRHRYSLRPSLPPLTLRAPSASYRSSTGRPPSPIDLSRNGSVGTPATPPPPWNAKSGTARARNGQPGGVSSAGASAPLSTLSVPLCAERQRRRRGAKVDPASFPRPRGERIGSKHGNSSHPSLSRPPAKQTRLQLRAPPSGRAASGSRGAA